MLRPSLLFALLLPALLAAQIPQEPTAPPPAPGGTRLVYDLPAYDVGRLLDKQPGAGLDAVMADLLAQLRVHLGDAATLTPLGGTQFAVDVRGDATAVAAIRPRVETKVLEMRIVAYDGWTDGAVTFDLKRQRARLETWLANGGRDLVRADPRQIARFNDDAKNGPLASGHLRWVPHLVAPRIDNPASWNMVFALMNQTMNGVPALAESTVAAFDLAEWNNGNVPDALRKSADAHLVEFVAINWKEVSFDGTDLDPKGIALAKSPDGRSAVNYRLRAEKCALYGDWSQKYLKKHDAILVDGTIVSAPYFLTRIPGNGLISGNFTEAEARTLVDRLRLGDLPIAPVLLRTGPIPK